MANQALANLVVNIVGTTNGLNGAINNAFNQIVGLERAVAQAGQAIGGTFGRILTGVAEGPLTGLAGGFGVIAAAATLAVAGITALSRALVECNQAAADMNDTIARIENTLGTGSEKVKSFADRMANDFGLSRKGAIDMAASLALFAQGAGVGADKADDLAVKLGEVSVDAARFYRVPIPEMMNRIKGALGGSSSALRDFGVNLSEPAVKAKAFAMHIGNGKRELTEQEKTLVRAALVMDRLAIAQGAAATQSGGYNAQMEIMHNRLSNIAAGIGKFVIPAFTLLLRLVNGVLWGIEKVVDGMGAVWDAAGRFVGLQESDEAKNERLLGIDQQRKEMTDEIAKEQQEGLRRKLASDQRRTGLAEFARNLQAAGFRGIQKDINIRQLDVAQQQLIVQKQLVQKIGGKPDKQIAVAR